MTRMTTSRFARGATLLVATLAAATTLAACQPRAAVSTTGAADTESSGTASTASPTASTASSGGESQPGTSAGSVTVSISAPVSLSGTGATPVTCVTSRHYRASTSSAVVNGDQLSFVVAVAGYRGAGSYPALVDVTLRQATGRITTVAGVPNVPAVLTSTGGSFTLSATSAEGRTFTGSLSWECGS